MTGPAFLAGDPAPPPLPLRSESDVVATWTDGPPVVSVICTTYQHVAYIEDALRGFLGQETPFPFEVLVRDDASSDGTADVVRDYAERFPTVVRATLEPVNRFPEEKGLWKMLASARGEFIALCEGDDYWIDATKLARQVKALRARPDAVLAHHERVVIHDGIITDEAIRWPQQARDWRATELGRSREPVTASVVFRNVDRYDGSVSRGITYEDNFLWLRLSRHGGAVFVPDLTASVYRVHDSGAHSGVPALARTPRATESWYWMSVWFAEDGDEDRATYCAIRSIAAVAVGLERAGVPALMVAWPHLARQSVLERMRRHGPRTRTIVDRMLAVTTWIRIRTRGW